MYLIATKSESVFFAGDTALRDDTDALVQRELEGRRLDVALLPIGHLVGRIPRGNIGRATVPVTQVMDPPEAVQRLIDWAVLGVRIPALSRPQSAP